MKKLLLFIPLLFVLTNCAGKLSPNTSVEDQRNLLRLNITLAINDAVDGIAAAHSALWLNDHDTVLVLTSFHVALETIRSSSDPKSAVLSALTDIKKQLPLSSVAKWNPYLDSLIAVLGAF